MAENVVEVQEDAFDQEVLKSDKPVLVDFWAPWCGPCRMVAPIVEELADEYAGRLVVAKMNTDDNQGLAAKLGITSIPTLMVFKNGELVENLVGLQPKKALKAILDKHL
jgi:thioredoxin 1